MKIAVFSSVNNFKDIRFRPKDSLVKISGINNIYGVKFDAVMQIWPGPSNKQELLAFEALKNRQPELF